MNTPTPTLDPATAQAVTQAGTAIGAGISTLLAVGFIINLILTLVCARMARNRGRNATLGALGGFCFGLIAVVYYLIAGDTVEARVRQEEAVRAQVRTMPRGGVQKYADRKE